MRGNAPAILLLMIVPLKGPNGIIEGVKAKCTFLYSIRKKNI